MTVAIHIDTLKIFQEVAAEMKQDLQTEVDRLAALEAQGKATKREIAFKASLIKIILD